MFKYDKYFTALFFFCSADSLYCILLYFIMLNLLRMEAPKLIEGLVQWSRNRPAGQDQTTEQDVPSPKQARPHKNIIRVERCADRNMNHGGPFLSLPLLKNSFTKSVSSTRLFPEYAAAGMRKPLRCRALVMRHFPILCTCLPPVDGHV